MHKHGVCCRKTHNSAKSYTDGLSGGLKVYIIIRIIWNIMHKNTINVGVKQEKKIGKWKCFE